MIGVYSPLANGSMFENGYLLECLRGIDNVIRESDYSLLLINEAAGYEENRKAKPKFIDYVSQKRIDGLIVLTIPSDGRLEGSLSAIIEEDFPVGYIGKRFSEKGMNVYASYEEYILDGIRRLYEKGHRRIAFLPLKSRSNTNLKLKSKAETKFTGLKINITDTVYNIDADFLRDILKVHDRRSTCDSNDLRRFGIIGKSAEYTVFHGKTAWRRYFRDLCRTCERSGSKDALPKIDCYYVPSLELGETIATELLNQLSGKKNTDLSKKYMPEYMDRGSVREI